MTSSIFEPVSISAVAMIVRLPPSSMLRAAPKKRFGRCNALASTPADRKFKAPLVFAVVRGIGLMPAAESSGRAETGRMMSDRGRHPGGAGRTAHRSGPGPAASQPQTKARPFPHGGAGVTRMAKASERQIALGRRTARGRCSIDGRCIAAEVLKNPLNHGRILDAGDHPQLPAATSA